jgi:hypothetical protein
LKIVHRLAIVLDLVHTSETDAIFPCHRRMGDDELKKSFAKKKVSKTNNHCDYLEDF